MRKSILIFILSLIFSAYEYGNDILYPDFIKIWQSTNENDEKKETDSKNEQDKKPDEIKTPPVEKTQEEKKIIQENLPILNQKDITAPASVTDLYASAGTVEGEIVLTWTAVGDDGYAGTASGYVVKYSTLSVTTQALFDSASMYIQNWIPLTAGQMESRTLSGLPGGTSFYLAVEAIDKAMPQPNQGSLSNEALAVSREKKDEKDEKEISQENLPILNQKDITAPASVTDLYASAGTVEGEIVLTWTAVGDDGYAGTASGYVVKYSTLSVTTQALFDSASMYIQNWIPLTAGQMESRTLSGLPDGTSFYIAVETIDEVFPKPNQGGLSNEASALAKEKKIIVSDITSDQEGIGITFPLESRLDISGRKSVGFKYSGLKYFGEAPEGSVGRKQVSSTFSLEQELQVRLTGTIAKRITVNVDYDDTKEQQRDISVLFKGNEDEFVQEAAFGDITLILPNTEFTGYNKKMFGAELKAKLNRFTFTAIGAQTKGLTKTISFTGSYTPVKADINDTGYIKNKYYTVYLNSSHLPITPGSEQIWIDDQDGTNNNFPPSYPPNRGADMTQYTQKTAPNAQYSFDFQHPGSDYTIDYNTGIVTFKKTVNSNYVIAVAYKYSNGAANVGYDAGNSFDFSESSLLVIQSGIIDTSHQLQNYYNIGQRNILPRQYDKDFKLITYDSNNQEVDISKFPYVIDYEFGIIQFTGSNQPFANDMSGNLLNPNAYSFSNAQSRYKIHIEYKYKFQSYKLPDFNIVKSSEKVIMDGQELKRDIDYTIDYESGFIFFLNQDKITDTTNITITYEYLPFGGQFQSNLFGARGEFNLTDNFFIGSTFIYIGSQSPLTAPTIDTTPSDLNIIDADTKLSFTESNIRDFSKFTGVPQFFLPTNVSLSAEVAKSIFNPNTFRADNGEAGVGMVDQMEGIDNISGASTSRVSWFYSSVSTNDSSLTMNNRSDPLQISEIEDFGHDISSYAGRKILLNLSYDFTNGIWDNIVTTLSKGGTDYSRFNFMEIWIKADWTSDVDFTIDLGVVNEDTNGNGLLDTEDKNLDGKLNPEEDTGIPGKWGGKNIIVGANNGILDTEDLDRNGRLDQVDSYFTFGFRMSSIPTSFISREVGDWKLIKIPIKTAFTTGTSLNPPDLRYVKHMRVSLKNTTGRKGTVIIESIQLTGNKWELKGTPVTPEKFDIKAVSGDIDNSYEPLIGVFYKPLTEAEKNREQSLSISYTLAKDTFYAQRIFAKQQDLLNYGVLKFDIFKKITHAGDILFIRLGSDELNYYQYEVVLDSISAKWQTVTLLLSGKDDKRTVIGTPFLNNIKQVSIGLKSTSTEDGEIWINNLRVADVKQISGVARRVSGSVQYGGLFSVSGNYKEVDSKFHSIENSSTDTVLSATQAYLTKSQTIRNMGVSSNFNPTPVLPMNFSFTRDSLITDDLDKENPDYFALPERQVDDYKGALGMSLLAPLVFSFEGEYKDDKQMYLPQTVTGDDTLNLSKSGMARAMYSLPEQFFFIPLGRNDLEASFRYTREESFHEKIIRNTDSDAREQYGKYAGFYDLLFTINPSFSSKFFDKKGSRELYNPSYGENPVPRYDSYEPQSHQRFAVLDVGFSKIPGIYPTAKYDAGVERDYILDQLRTRGAVEVSSEIKFASWWSFLESASPTIGASHRIESTALYDKCSVPSFLNTSLQEITPGETSVPAPSVEKETLSVVERLSLQDVWWISPRETLALNSGIVVSDVFTSRFKLFDKFNFNPKLTLRDERNRQKNFLTKANTISAGGSLIWDDPGFFKSWLNPTSVNFDYTWTNVKQRDSKDTLTSDSVSHRGNFALPFRPSDGFSGNLLMGIEFQRITEQTVVKNNISYNPAIEINHALFFPGGSTLDFWPFKGVKLDQSLRFQYRFDVKIVRNKEDNPTKTIKVESEQYNFSLGLQYFFSKYIQTDLGGNIGYFHDRVIVGNDYLNYGINLKLNARF